MVVEKPGEERINFKTGIFYLLIFPERERSMPPKKPPNLGSEVPLFVLPKGFSLKASRRGQSKGRNLVHLVHVETLERSLVKCN